MICIKCNSEIPDESTFCLRCGFDQNKSLLTKKPKSRGNGYGSAYKLPNGSWRAVVTLGYEKPENGKRKRVERTKSGFKTKKEALEYLPKLRGKPKSINTAIRFKELYELWLPTHEATKSTINCYKAAFKYYEPVWFLQFSDIGIDDLQECIDDCIKGKRTRQNMKALGTLLYKYAIPRGYVPENINYASFIKVGSGELGTREAFTDKEIELVKKSLDKVKYADYIYCMIYTGFRPSEFLSLDVTKYNKKEKCFVGGSKTEAGTNRSVTVSPKIQPIVLRLTQGKSKGIIFCDDKGHQIPLKKFREDCFYPALEKIGIERKLTPYCCRHTFATLMKRVTGSDRDKLELMGHTSEEMLRHYQDVSYEDLRKITDAL